MNRTRLIVATVALGALALVPGALATSGVPFSANDLSFGGVAAGTTTSPATVTITNSDTTAHTINSLALAGANPKQFAITADHCSSATLNPNGSCTVDVTFSPVGAAGARNAHLVVHYGGSTQSDVSELNGTATAPAPVVGVNDIAFGAVKVGASKVGTLTITNSGAAALHITTIVRTGGGVFAFSNDNCTQSTVAAGSSCTVTVTFNPVLPSAYASVVTITDNAANSPQTANLNGTGLSQFVTFTPTPYDFGTSTIGHRGGPVQFTLHNQDSVPLTFPAGAFTNVSGNVGAFKVTGDGCSHTTVAASSTCNFSVVYTATAVGHQAVGIAVADSASDSPQTLALTGAGRPPAPFTNLRGAVGCTTATLLWGVPSGVSGSWIVRNAHRVPLSPHDGTRIRRTGPGLRAEKNLTQFHTYHYAIYAQYKVPGFKQVIYSAPRRLALRTGRVCKPQRGARLTGTTPVIDWTPAPGATGYALRIYNHGVQIQLWSKVTTISQYKVPASWRHNGVTRRLQHGQPYTIFVYAYSKKHPRGIGIGSSSFSVK